MLLIAFAFPMQTNAIARDLRFFHFLVSALCICVWPVVARVHLCHSSGFVRRQLCSVIMCIPSQSIKWLKELLCLDFHVNAYENPANTLCSPTLVRLSHLLQMLKPPSDI